MDISTADKIKIVDCFIFYNELELLTYRLNILSTIVDYFVIVESTRTFTGKEKPLFFDENKSQFDNFKDKIIHVIVEDLPHKYSNINFNKNEQWTNEYCQRNAIERGLNNISNLNNNDIIIISDVDEIPDSNTLDKIKKHVIKVDYNSLEMDLYYYNLNTKFKCKWVLCKIIEYKKYRELKMSCNTIRVKQAPSIPKGGWHLSYFGDSNFIQNKLNNFGHQELNKPNFTNLSNIEERVKKSRDLFDRPSLQPERIEIKDNTYLPIEYDKWLIKYISSS